MRRTLWTTDLAEAAYKSEGKCRYYGRYNGKFYHRGFAIVFNPKDTVHVVHCLPKRMGEPDHKDEMALDVIWSWNASRFLDEEEPAEPTEHVRRSFDGGQSSVL